MLFEAFRDTLVDVQNQGFPVYASATATRTDVPAVRDDRDERLHAFMRIVDERIGHYFELEPMVVVVAGEKELQIAFSSVTTKPAAIVGYVDGDFTKTSPSDLGRIVWPVVKEAMSGLRERALRDLENATDAEKICGLETVARRVSGTVGATLLVEEDYHVRGSISQTDESATISPNVDVRDEIDDVIDMLIEKVLGSGGNVVFEPAGSLSKQGRIVLLLRAVDGAH